MNRKWLVVMITAALAGPGCGWRKQHIVPGYGSSCDRAFAAQAVPRKGGPAQAAAGLDSQEAAIVSQTYRTGLSPKDVKPKDQPILLVAPPSRDGAPKLAPSVPQER
jgi:hypothetical protein